MKKSSIILLSLLPLLCAVTVTGMGTRAWQRFTTPVKTTAPRSWANLAALRQQNAQHYLKPVYLTAGQALFGKNTAQLCGTVIQKAQQKAASLWCPQKPLTAPQVAAKKFTEKTRLTLFQNLPLLLAIAFLTEEGLYSLGQLYGAR